MQLSIHFKCLLITYKANNLTLKIKSGHIMAFTTLLVTFSIVTIANADFPGWNNDNQFPRFPIPMMPSLPFGPKPSLPGMPNFGKNFPFFQLPAFPIAPTINFPSMPSASDIVNAKPSKGGTFTGVMIISKTEAKKNPDGTIVKQSGSTIVMNNDGVVTVKKTGNAPDIPTNAPPTPITPPNPFQFRNFNDFKRFEDINNFGFRHSSPFIDPEKIETYVPGPGETFQGHSFKTSGFSTNNNGKVTQGGSFAIVENDNGRVNKQHHTFGTPPS